jgi:GTPase Era involved in 16S rRNA processing
MEFDELESKYEKLQSQFQLFKNIIKSEDNINLKVDLSKIEKIINETLPNALEKNAPPNFPELFFDFKYEYSKFKDFILYEQLIGKSIVALGGSFSSGKSSFLNSLMKKSILPSEIDPSTSVPAYIVNGEDTKIYGINVFDSKIEMGLKDIKAISHGFGEEIDENQNVTSEEVTLGHILESIFLVTPLQTYKNIAFLDTPGYSKPDTTAYSSKTDEKIARVQLNSSDYILWFVKIDDGTIKDDDINFINTLKKEIPKLIIVSKADKLPQDDVNKIVKEVKEMLDIKGIQYVDVLSYSRKKPNDFDSKKIKEYIEKWDGRVQESTFAYNFKVLFVKCKEYYEDIIEDESRRLNRLNTALTLSENDTVTECLSSLQIEIKKNIKELKSINEKLKKLQNGFFTEIKFISDVVGIKMPEPSEIDLIKDKVKDPLKVVEEFKKKHGINNSDDLTMILTDTYSSINPVIDRTLGNSDYKEEVYDMLEENLIVDKSKIKFGK